MHATKTSSGAACTVQSTTDSAHAPATHGEAGLLLGLDQHAIDRLRTEWFAQQGGVESALRLDVDFEDLVDHLDAAFDLELLHSKELREAAISRLVENLDDLLLAIACVRGRHAAWVELEQEIGPLLARMCELRIDQTDAMLHASRFLRSVQARTRDENLADDLPVTVEADLDEDDGTPCLQDYTGLHPLRAFLGGPLFAMLQDLIRDGLVEATRSGDPGDRSNRRLRLVD